MTCFIKKINIAVALLLITIGNTYGDYNNSSACNDSLNCFPCEPSSCGTGFIGAELIYWRAFENGLDTCIPKEFCEREGSHGETISKFKARGKEPDFKWNPGFRIGAGYEFACSNWGVGAIWTHFHSSSTANNIHWKINLDVIDAVAAYDYNFGNCFALIPFFGVRGAIINQNLRVSQFSCSERSSSLRGLANQDSKNKENFWGVGPLLGLEADWNMWCGFSLYGNAAVSWLYGDFDIRTREFDRSDDSQSFCKVRKNLDASVVAADFGIGIRWQQCIWRNMELIVQLGLEHHRYFDYNRFGNYGDLSFDGFNFGAGIEF